MIIQLESYDEKEAQYLQLINKDTTWTNVWEKLFPSTSDSTNNRLYDFKIENLDFIVPMSDKSILKYIAGILESGDDVQNLK